MAIDKAVNSRIREIRQALGLSQVAFSKGIHLKSSGYLAGIELGNVEANPRIIELVSAVYGASKRWIQTGEGQMFDAAPDNTLQEMTIYFNQLNPDFKRYVVRQIKALLELQRGEG